MSSRRVAGKISIFGSWTFVLAYVSYDHIFGQTIGARR
jgi:hypothetical protein